MGHNGSTVNEQGERAMSSKPVNELKWYYEPLENPDPGMPQHAIIDEEGYIVVGMAHMRESVAREICDNHNKLLK